jgi:single-strand DNA-binding protein
MFHRIIIVGNLGRDPEMRYTPSGTPVTNFSVATNRTYTNANGEQVKETIWFRVSAWGKQAETTNQYLRKGSRVLVEGRLIADPATGGPRIWTRQDGAAAASFEVHALTVRFLSSREETESAARAMGNAAPVDDLPAEEDEIPF